jgi:hypothetical protein
MSTWLKRRGPRWRAVVNARNSECASRSLSALDWDNWWQDDGYIHVRAFTPDEGETWHRVYPRPLKGFVCTRVGVMEGQLRWLFDRA